MCPYLAIKYTSVLKRGKMLKAQTPKFVDTALEQTSSRVWNYSKEKSLNETAARNIYTEGPSVKKVTTVTEIFSS